MVRGVLLAGLALGTVLPASAQEIKLEASLAAAAAAIEDKSPLAPAPDGFLVDARLAMTRTDTLQSGLQLIWRGEVRIERDAGSRPAFAGVLGDCPPTIAGCPSLVGPGGLRSPISPTTGLAVSGRPLDRGVFASLEGASLTLAGPWGEGEAGLDSGVATRLDARPPTVLEAVSAFSPSLDPTGLDIVRARNDVTGPSFKLSYMSPRFLGLRVGASWTPEANQRGADFDPAFEEPGLARADLTNVFEGALSFAYTFTDPGLRVRAAITTTEATSASDFSAFGDYRALGAGLELERGKWTSGVRWLKSNNAWRPDEADYEAVEWGLVRQGRLWRIGIEAGWAKDKLNLTEGSTWLVGVRRKLTPVVDVGLAWSRAAADLPLADVSGLRHTNARNDGLVVELGVRK